MAEFVHYRVCYMCDRTYEDNYETIFKGCPYCGSKRSKRVGRMYEDNFRKIVAGYEGKEDELLMYQKVSVKGCYNCDRIYEYNDYTRKNGCPFCGSKRHKRTGRYTKAELNKLYKEYEKEGPVSNLVVKQISGELAEGKV